MRNHRAAFVVCCCTQLLQAQCLDPLVTLTLRSWVMLLTIRYMIHLILGVVGIEQIVLRKLKTRIKSVNQWMNLNQLKMSNDNTEFLLVFIRSRHQVLKCESNLINVCDVTDTKSL